MVTYRELLETAIRDKNSWVHCDEDLALKLSIDDPKSCREFILNFFKDTSKESSLLVQKINKLENFRLQHIISVFFLGIAMYSRVPQMKIHVDNSLNDFKGFIYSHHKNPFPFIWFLICLFHDLAYVYEERKVNKSQLFTSFSDLQREFGLLGSPTAVPSLYTKDIHQKYFDYRNRPYQFDGGNNDHGICAGYMLYHDCCKIREENANNEEGKWDPRLVNVYNYAAWVVACHNIWTAKEKNEYHEAGLEALDWLDGRRPISSIDHPVFFMFCLLDSIEPIKVIRDTELLDKLLIEMDDEALVIEILFKCACRNKMDERIKDLNNWITTASQSEGTWRICLHSHHDME